MSPTGSPLDGQVPRGTLLAGRYRLTDPDITDVPGASAWYGHDEILGRDLSITVVSGPHAERAVEEAMRTALARDARLARVLDAGPHGEAYYLVTERLPPDNLTGYAPAEPAQARAVVSDLASVLESAREFALHHLMVRPQAVRVRAGRAVVLTGLGLDAVMFQATARDALTSSRRDAVDLVRLLYYCLTGYLPGPVTVDVPAAPQRDGVTLPLTEFASEFPADLVEMCTDTLTSPDLGPRTPGELYRNLGSGGRLLLMHAGSLMPLRDHSGAGAAGPPDQDAGAASLSPAGSPAGVGGPDVTSPVPPTGGPGTADRAPHWQAIQRPGGDPVLGGPGSASGIAGIPVAGGSDRPDEDDGGASIGSLMESTRWAAVRAARPPEWRTLRSEDAAAEDAAADRPETATTAAAAVGTQPAATQSGVTEDVVTEGVVTEGVVTSSDADGVDTEGTGTQATATDGAVPVGFAGDGTDAGTAVPVDTADGVRAGHPFVPDAAPELPAPMWLDLPPAPDAASASDPAGAPDEPASSLTQVSSDASPAVDSADLLGGPSLGAGPEFRPVGEQEGARDRGPVRDLEVGLVPRPGPDLRTRRDGTPGSGEHASARSESFADLEADSGPIPGADREPWLQTSDSRRAEDSSTPGVTAEPDTVQLAGQERGHHATDLPEVGSLAEAEARAAAVLQPTPILPPEVTPSSVLEPPAPPEPAAAAEPMLRRRDLHGEPAGAVPPDTERGADHLGGAQGVNWPAQGVQSTPVGPVDPGRSNRDPRMSARLFRDPKWAPVQEAIADAVAPVPPVPAPPAVGDAGPAVAASEPDALAQPPAGGGPGDGVSAAGVQGEVASEGESSAESAPLGVAPIADQTFQEPVAGAAPDKAPTGGPDATPDAALDAALDAAEGHSRDDSPFALRREELFSPDELESTAADATPRERTSSELLGQAPPGGVGPIDLGFSLPATVMDPGAIPQGVAPAQGVAPVAGAETEEAARGSGSGDGTESASGGGSAHAAVPPQGAGSADRADLGDGAGSAQATVGHELRDHELAGHELGGQRWGAPAEPAGPGPEEPRAWASPADTADVDAAWDAFRSSHAAGRLRPGSGEPETPAEGALTATEPGFGVSSPAQDAGLPEGPTDAPAGAPTEAPAAAPTVEPGLPPAGTAEAPPPLRRRRRSTNSPAGVAWDPDDVLQSGEGAPPWPETELPSELLSPPESLVQPEGAGDLELTQSDPAQPESTQPEGGELEPAPLAEQLPPAGDPGLAPPDDQLGDAADADPERQALGGHAVPGISGGPAEDELGAQSGEPRTPRRLGPFEIPLPDLYPGDTWESIQEEEPPAWKVFLEAQRDAQQAQPRTPGARQHEGATSPALTEPEAPPELPRRISLGGPVIATPPDADTALPLPPVPPDTAAPPEITAQPEPAATQIMPVVPDEPPARAEEKLDTAPPPPARPSYRPVTAAGITPPDPAGTATPPEAREEITPQATAPREHPEPTATGTPVPTLDWLVQSSQPHQPAGVQPSAQPRWRPLGQDGAPQVPPVPEGPPSANPQGPAFARLTEPEDTPSEEGTGKPPRRMSLRDIPVAEQDGEQST